MEDPIKSQPSFAARVALVFEAHSCGGHSDRRTVVLLAMQPRPSVEVAKGMRPGVSPKVMTSVPSSFCSVLSIH